jgi:hypothetical protein
MLYTETTTRTVLTKRNFPMNPYQKLTSFINDLILDKGVCDQDGHWLNVESLSYPNLKQFSALLLDYDDRDTSECFNKNMRSDEDDITIALLKLLNHDTHENRDDFIDLVIENILAKYKTTMQRMIDAQCAYLNQRAAS